MSVAFPRTHRPPQCGTHVWVDNADEVAESVTSAGGDVHVEPMDAVPVHWGVDFWVAELDATAEKADQLGGKVLAPPYEIPDTPLRQAVLADPQGAPFSVTKVTIAR